jgi:hypothetical protein
MIGNISMIWFFTALAGCRQYSSMTALHLGLFTQNNFRILSANLACNDIVKHPDLPWTRYDLSGNRTMTLEHWKIFNDGTTGTTGAKATGGTGAKATGTAEGAGGTTGTTGATEGAEGAEGAEGTSKFPNLTGGWCYDMLVSSFGTQGRREVFPLPLGLKILRAKIKVESIKHIDWFEANYIDHLRGEWCFSRKKAAGFGVAGIQELYKREIIGIENYRKLLVSRPDITLATIERSGGVKAFQGLLKYLPMADMPRLMQTYNIKDYYSGEHSVFNRREISKEWFELWAREFLIPDEAPANIGLSYGVANDTMYGLMLNGVIGAISLRSLSRWTDKEKTDWNRYCASSNRNLPVGWLFDTFDKWPRVYGSFHTRKLYERASLLEYIVHLRDPALAKGHEPQIDLIFIRSKRSELYLGMYAGYRHAAPFLPTLEHLCQIPGIRLEDFYFFFPSARPHPRPNPNSVLGLYDLDFIFG